MAHVWEEDLSMADEMRGEGNACFRGDDLSGAVLRYTEGVKSLNRVEATLLDTTYLTVDNNEDNTFDYMRSLRLVLHSNLAETYLRLGMGYKAKEHCHLALTIDEEDDAVHERLRHATLSCEHYSEISAKVFEKVERMDSAKDTGNLVVMVDVARELFRMTKANTGKMDAHLRVKTILGQADSEIILAKALLKESHAVFNNGASSVSAISHFDRCSDLCCEAASLCATYCDDKVFGFDASDTSAMGCNSRWRANILNAEANFKHSRALMMKEMARSKISLSNYIPTLKSWNDDDRAGLYSRLASAREHLFTGRGALKSLLGSEEVLSCLKERKMHLEIEILRRLVLVDWIGLQLQCVKEYAKAVETTFEAMLTQEMNGGEVNNVCAAISRTYESLFDTGEPVLFPIVSSLLSACIHGYKIAGNNQMQIDTLRLLIGARRKCWMSRALPSYSPTSETDASEDKTNITQLIDALKKTGREVGEECPICYESLVGSGVVNPLGCDHIFHNHCCQRYFAGKVSSTDMTQALLGHQPLKQLPCPVCRQQHFMKIMGDGSFMEI
mmetsp:Transcript_31796/g.93362  ORF Transcript_31796/g.93362 Transcript_31796/m.93362 type:complete len:558 (-) Transcript_31796:2502-4175(-)